MAWLPSLSIRDSVIAFSANTTMEAVVPLNGQTSFSFNRLTFHLFPYVYTVHMIDDTHIIYDIYYKLQFTVIQLKCLNEKVI